MNAVEKFGLILVLIYFGHDFPESWKGAEVIIFLIGNFLFMLGNKILDSFQKENK